MCEAAATRAHLSAALCSSRGHLPEGKRQADQVDRHPEHRGTQANGVVVADGGVDRDGRHEPRHAGKGQDAVRRYFRFIDEVLREAAPVVENAVYVSYLENLRFEGRNAGPVRARELLTPRLQQALADLEKYLGRLFEDG